MSKGWRPGEALAVAKQRVINALRECECSGVQSDRNAFLKGANATTGETVAMEDLGETLLQCLFPGDAGSVRYPTGIWWRMSCETDAAAKMHSDSATDFPAGNPD